MLERKRWITALLALLALFVATSRAEDYEPFKISGGGVVPNGIPLPGEPPSVHTATGTGSYLGKYSGQGSVQTYTAVLQPNGHYLGTFGSGEPFVFTGADGDELVCQYGRTDLPPKDGGAKKVGVVELVPTPDGKFVAYFVAEFVSVRDQCTGKFEGCSAHWYMYATTDPFVLGSTDPVNYTWHGEGKIKFKDD